MTMTVSPDTPWKQGHDGPDWGRITVAWKLAAIVPTGKRGRVRGSGNTKRRA
jgi:hypothetical protein